MKFMFLQLGIKSNFLKLVSNKLNMFFMFFQVLGVNEDVINVTNTNHPGIHRKHHS